MQRGNLKCLFLGGYLEIIANLNPFDQETLKHEYLVIKRGAYEHKNKLKTLLVK